jgi:hypothetical protein
MGEGDLTMGAQRRARRRNGTSRVDIHTEPTKKTEWRRIEGARPPGEASPQAGGVALPKLLAFSPFLSALERVPCPCHARRPDGRLRPARNGKIL